MDRGRDTDFSQNQNRELATPEGRGDSSSPAANAQGQSPYEGAGLRASGEESAYHADEDARRDEQGERRSYDPGDWDETRRGKFDFGPQPVLHRDDIEPARVIDLSDTPFYRGEPASRQPRRARASGPTDYGVKYEPVYREDASGKKPKTRWGSSEKPVRRKGQYRGHRDAVIEAVERGMDWGSFSIEQGSTGQKIGRPAVGVTASDAVLDWYAFLLDEYGLTVEEALSAKRRGRTTEEHREVLEIVRAVLAEMVYDGANASALARASGHDRRRVHEYAKNDLPWTALSGDDLAQWLLNLQTGQNSPIDEEALLGEPALQTGQKSLPNAKTEAQSPAPLNAPLDDVAPPKENPVPYDLTEEIEALAVAEEAAEMTLAQIRQVKASLVARYPGFADQIEKLLADIQAKGK